jgi:hypothetical protein
MCALPSEVKRCLFLVYMCHFLLVFFSQDLHICLLASEASVQSHHEDVNSSNELNFLVICNYDAHDPDNLFKQETTPSKHFLGNLFLPFLRNSVLESGQAPDLSRGLIRKDPWRFLETQT